MAQRLLTAGLVGVALMAALPSEVASAAAPAPRGGIDAATISGGAVATITGWAIDPAHPTRATAVRVIVDGRGVTGWVTTSGYRADVNRALATSGNHGFRVTATVGGGRHTVCTTARSVSATGPSSRLGCFTVTVAPPGTAAAMRTLANQIDPRHTVTWQWKHERDNVAGLTYPWSARITISPGYPLSTLRSVMLHEWSHILQWRAYGGTYAGWQRAMLAFNNLIGRAGDKTSYFGLERGADCIATALGAPHTYYGCPASLQRVGAHIAHTVH